MCGRLVNLDTVARVLADYYHLKTETQLAALDEALSRVPAETVGGGHEKDHVADPGKMVGDLISRAEALEAMDTWDKFGCDPDGKLVRYDDDKHYIPYVHYEDMVHAIKHLPSAQRWIPCSERLPEPGVYVLVDGADIPGGDRFPLIDKICDDGEWLNCDGSEWSAVAWMPIPEPWKGERDG